MKIKRKINKQNVEIELTEEELREAHNIIKRRDRIEFLDSYLKMKGLDHILNDKSLHENFIAQWFHAYDKFDSTEEQDIADSVLFELEGGCHE